MTLDSDEYRASVEEMIERYVRDAAELPDRTSPPEAPKMLLIAETELADLLRRFADEMDEPLGDDPGRDYSGCPV